MHFATGIKGNLEQTHLASRDRRLLRLGFGSEGEKNAEPGDFSNPKLAVLDIQGGGGGGVDSLFVVFFLSVFMRAELSRGSSVDPSVTSRVSGRLTSPGTVGPLLSFHFNRNN